MRQLCGLAIVAFCIIIIDSFRFSGRQVWKIPSSECKLATEARFRSSNSKIFIKKIEEEEKVLQSSESSGKQKTKKYSRSKKSTQPASQKFTSIENIKEDSFESKNQTQTIPHNDVPFNISKLEINANTQKATGIFPSQLDNTRDEMDEFPNFLEQRPMMVPQSNPLDQNMIAPEVVFFGEPRNPPPRELTGDLKYHGLLLRWARHANVAPRDSDERLKMVFPKGPTARNAIAYRINNSTESLSSNNVSFEDILNSFVKVMDNLQEAKLFIDANIDVVLPRLFLRSLTAKKLSAQSRNQLDAMERMKAIRDQYILATDQIYFPFRIEIEKAETRVMTYVGRDELRMFAQKWDEVEMSLYFVTLLASRLAWDAKVEKISEELQQKLQDTVGYMVENVKRDFINRQYRKPALTAEMYRNASMALMEMPEIYEKIRPEVKLVHETYFVKDEADIVRFVKEKFCPDHGITLNDLIVRLRVLEGCLVALQVVDYMEFRGRVQWLGSVLSSEMDGVDGWFYEFCTRPSGGYYDFQTYEPDEIPVMEQFIQRGRDTGNAFSNFFVQELGFPTQYTDAFSGKRPKGAELDNWLERDPIYNVTGAESYNEALEHFRIAFVKQTELRKESEKNSNILVKSRLQSHESLLSNTNFLEDEEVEESKEENKMDNQLPASQRIERVETEEEDEEEEEGDLDFSDEELKIMLNELKL